MPIQLWKICNCVLALPYCEHLNANFSTYFFAFLKGQLLRLHFFRTFKWPVFAQTFFAHLFANFCNGFSVNHFGRFSCEKNASAKIGPLNMQKQVQKLAFKCSN